MGLIISLSDMGESQQILFPSCFFYKSLRFLGKPRWWGYPGACPVHTLPGYINTCILTGVEVTTGLSKQESYAPILHIWRPYRIVATMTETVCSVLK